MKFFYVSLTLVFAVPLWGQSHPDLGDFEDYPEDSKIWLATMAGEVVVNPVFPVLATELTTLKWDVADGAEVKEDEILGHRNAEKIDLSRRDLELRKSKYPNELNDLEWANRDKKKALAASIDELHHTINGMVLTPKELELLGVDFEKKLKKERKELEEELELMKGRLEGEYFDQALESERTALNLDLDTAFQTHDELVKSSRILSPSDGRLEILVSEPLKVEQEVARVPIGRPG